MVRYWLIFIIFFLQIESKRILICDSGSIMIVSWIMLSTIGILHASIRNHDTIRKHTQPYQYFLFLFKGYFKYIKRKMCGFDFWFAIHRPCMIAVTLLSLAGFIMIFYQKNWTWVDPKSTKSFIHSLCGATTICLALIQVFPIYPIEFLIFI